MLNCSGKNWIALSYRELMSFAEKRDRSPFWGETRPVYPDFKGCVGEVLGLSIPPTTHGGSSQSPGRPLRAPMRRPQGSPPHDAKPHRIKSTRRFMASCKLSIKVNAVPPFFG